MLWYSFDAAHNFSNCKALTSLEPLSNLDAVVER